MHAMIADRDLQAFCESIIRAGGTTPEEVTSSVREDLDTVARQKLDDAIDAFGFSVPLADFTHFVSARVDPTIAPAAALEALAIKDLYLACACILGIKGAADEFVNQLSGEIAKVATRFARNGAVAVDDLVQIVTTRLLLADGEKVARLTLYRGQGPLSGFVRVTAARLAINIVTGPASAEASEPEHDLFSALVSPSATPETQVDSEHVRSRVRDAFVVAVGRLSARDRNLLHYSLCDGLSIDVIARMYRVHRATAARWIAAARDDLVKTTRAELRELLAVPDTEVDTLLRGGLSRFELSVARVLRDAGDIEAFDDAEAEP
jgi:RNA polymerase sigma-70 factor (ECF subfamily)